MLGNDDIITEKNIICVVCQKVTSVRHSLWYNLQWQHLRNLPKHWNCPKQLSKFHLKFDLQSQSQSFTFVSFIHSFTAVNELFNSTSLAWTSQLLHKVRGVFLSVGPGRQDLYSDVCDDHGLLKLCRKLSIGCHSSPVVRPRLVGPNSWK